MNTVEAVHCYLFGHEDSRDKFAISHDLKILKEVFDVEPGEYRRTTTFWQSHGIRDWFSLHESELSEDIRTTLNEKIEAIRQRYAAVSQQYQSASPTTVSNWVNNHALDDGVQSTPPDLQLSDMQRFGIGNKLERVQEALSTYRHHAAKPENRHT